MTIRLEGITRRFGGGACARRGLARDRARRVLRRARPVRLRQEHDAAADRRPRSAGRGAASRSASASSPIAGPRCPRATRDARRRRGVPVVRAVAAHDGGPSRSPFRLRWRRSAARRSPRAPTSAWRRSPLERFADRRPEALSGGQRQARRARPLPRPGGERDPDGRAARQTSIRTCAPRWRRSSRPSTRAPGATHALHHARSARGDGAGRPHRGAGRGARAAGSAAPDELYRRPPRRARRGVHRAGGDRRRARRGGARACRRRRRARSGETRAVRESDRFASSRGDGSAEWSASCRLGGCRVEALCGGHRPVGAGRLFVRPENVTVLGEAEAARASGEALTGRIAHVTYRGGIWEARIEMAGLRREPGRAVPVCRRTSRAPPHVGEALIAARRQRLVAALSAQSGGPASRPAGKFALRFRAGLVGGFPARALRPRFPVASPT